ncbi:proteasomal ubiquitin receptor ADRM1 homolog isoform X2 [Neocloeon triangulifer]|uniref:proteasomal ubiquitin receptor ADRM1 homolog isoform X2 n=1 Tax=Neocloeon triangulifer TaxID=2078957 RepID=UPI00286F65FC|nr:proteasomal ubiquitin receptor ADRM1 homolog isoform X2 [Neocloeon triangulifer]
MSSRGALFCSGGGARGANKHLVEFRAGKMTQKGKMVHPDKRKGLLYVYQAEDSLMHLCWKERHSSSVEDDLIIFPDDCEYKRVPQCTTGRVYVLKFKSSHRLFFFWMQETKIDKDDDLCKKVNELLNNPPTPGSSRSGGATPDSDLQSLLNTMSQQQLMQFFGNVGQIGNLSSLLGPSGSPSSGGTAISSRTPTRSSASSKPSAEKASSSEPKAAPEQPAEGNVDLSSSLTVENLQAMLADPTTVRQLQRHLPPLTDSTSEAEQLRTTLQSPQFQQAVSMFSAALQSGQLGPVVQQFEVGADAVRAANQGDLEEFVRSLQRHPRDSEQPPDSESQQPPQ